MGYGPFGRECTRNELEVGDIVQLSFDGSNFGHSLLVVNNNEGNIYVATHTFDAYNRNLDSYSYVKCRMVKIDGYRKW